MLHLESVENSVGKLVVAAEILCVFFLFGCASVVTSSTYEGTVPASAKKTYENCVLKTASLEENDNGIHVTDVDGWELESLKIQARRLLRDRGVCKNLIEESTKEQQWPVALGAVQVENYLNKTKTPKDANLEINFYVPREGANVSSGSMYLLYGGVYVLSLGLIPMGMSESSEIWMTTRSPEETKTRLISLKNKSSVWMWTPLYLFKGEDARDATKNNQAKLVRESVEKGLNQVLN